jgi:hypothetical protein
MTAAVQGGHEAGVGATSRPRLRLALAWLLIVFALPSGTDGKGASWAKGTVILKEGGN